MQISLEPVLYEQELVGDHGEPFWSGAVDVFDVTPGTLGRRLGSGYVELTGYFAPVDLGVYTSDLFSDNGNGEWFTPQYLHEMIGGVQRERLDVKTIFGMHYDVTPYANVVAFRRKFINTKYVWPAPVLLSLTTARRRAKAPRQLLNAAAPAVVAGASVWAAADSTASLHDH